MKLNSLSSRILLLVAQLFLSLVSIYALYQIVGILVFGTNEPTPTCPSGLYTYMSREVVRQCTTERLDMYAPKWAIPVVRIAVPGNILWLLGSIVIRRGLKTSGANGKKWDSWLQLGVFGIAPVLYSLIMPWHLLILLVVFGTEAFRQNCCLF
jgi:hypothetical protein